MGKPLTIEKLTEIFLFTKVITTDIAWIERNGVETIPTIKLKEVVELNNTKDKFPPLSAGEVRSIFLVEKELEKRGEEVPYDTEERKAARKFVF